MSMLDGLIAHENIWAWIVLFVTTTFFNFPAFATALNNEGAVVLIF